MMRESQKAHDYRRNCLPYGMWTARPVGPDSRLVLFNRHYKPIWQRWPDGRVEAADRAEWVRFGRQEYFYWDGWRPSQDKLEQILGAFCSGRLKVLRDAIEEKETRHAADRAHHEQRLGIAP